MEKQWPIENPLSCPIVSTINVIGGKWKPMLLHMLINGAMRFGELKVNIPKISHKMLTQQLRELENDNIVVRTVYPEVPPKVTYALSDKGVSLIPILDLLYAWGSEHVVISSSSIASS